MTKYRNTLVYGIWFVVYMLHIIYCHKLLIVNVFKILSNKYNNSLN